MRANESRQPDQVYLLTQIIGNGLVMGVPIDANCREILRLQIAVDLK